MVMSVEMVLNGMINFVMAVILACAVWQELL